MLRTMLTLALEGGDMAKAAQTVPIEAISKPTSALSVDVVTETDRNVEEWIIKGYVCMYVWKEGMYPCKTKQTKRNQTQQKNETNQNNTKTKTKTKL